jgi:drug/metabolite transporter (DMT)-like permease
MDCGSGGSAMPSPVTPNARLIELIVIAGIVMLVALLSAAIAAVANRRWSERSETQLTTFAVFVLVIAFFVLTVGWMLLLMSSPCGESPACDAGAMAATGAIMLGAVGLISVVLIGAPVAYFTIRAIRRR